MAAGRSCIARKSEQTFLVTIVKLLLLALSLQESGVNVRVQEH